MSTHNIGFYEEISKIITLCHQIRTLFLLLEICPKGAEGMANSVEPDQTAPLGTV